MFGCALDIKYSNGDYAGVMDSFGPFWDLARLPPGGVGFSTKPPSKIIAAASGNMPNLY
jgi:hypothetical protein